MSRIVITGTSRGLGKALVSTFADAGWNVVAASRESPAEVDDPRVRHVRWDVTSNDTSPLTDAVGTSPVDVVVNNAGMGSLEFGLDELSVSALQQVMDVNVYGVVRATQALHQNLLVSVRPIVLNVSSRLGSIEGQADGRYAQVRTSYAYRVSKAAQNMLTSCLARELGSRIRVWAVHPGVLATALGSSDGLRPAHEAARDLLRLARSSDRRSPRFCDVGGPDLPW